MHKKLDKLALHAQRSALCPSDYLEQTSKRRPARDGARYALFSSLVLENMLRVPWVRRTGLVCALALIGLCVAHLVSASTAGTIPPYTLYRFTALELRNGTSAPTSPGIATFGLLRKGESHKSTMGQSSMPCLALDAGGVLSVDGAYMTLSLASKGERRFDMWFITTLEGGGTEGGDAVRFLLEGSDDGVAWEGVGSSTSVTYFNSVVGTHGVAGVPTGRGRRLVLDATMRLSHWTSYVFVPFASGAGIFLANILAQRGEPRSAVFWSAVTCALVWICFPVILHRQLFGGGVSLLYPSTGILSQGLAWLAWGLSISAVRLWEMVSVHRGLRPAKSAYGLVWQRVCSAQLPELRRLQETACRIEAACRGAVARQQTSWSVVTGTKILDLPPSAMGTAVSPIASPTLQSNEPPCVSPMQSVGPSESSQRDAGDVLWSTQKPSSGQCRTFEVRRGSSTRSLSVRNCQSWEGGAQSGMQTAMSSALTLSSPRFSGSDGARRTSSRSFSMDFLSLGQTLSTRISRLLSGKGGNVHPDAMDTVPFVTSDVLQDRELGKLVMRNVNEGADDAQKKDLVETLDTLHAQAFMICDIFTDFVVELARSHGGKFRLLQPEGDVVFGEWDGQDATKSRFKLGGTKNIARAISKLNTAYNRDVSRLLDMCRETVYFDTISSMEGCLEALAADPTIDIVFIKNKMPAGEGENNRLWDRRLLWAGMPFVRVNITLSRVDAARELCVDAHVCELLLVLSDIGRVQTVEMRSAYRKWRKCQRSVTWFLDFVRWPKSSESKIVPSMVEAEIQGHDAPALSEKRRSLEPMPAPSSLNDRQVYNDDLDIDLSVPQGQGGDNGDRMTGGTTSWGLKLTAEMEELLKGLSRMATLGASSVLDKRWKSLTRGDSNHGFKSSSLSGLFYSRHPITAATSRKKFQLFLLVLGGYEIYTGINFLLNMEKTFFRGDAFGPFKHYRLETRMTRDGRVGRDILSPGVSGFGMLGQSRCSRHATLPTEGDEIPEPVPSFSGPVGTSFLVNYLEGFNMTGFYLHTGSLEGSEGQDPEYFNVWATNENFHLGDGNCALGSEDHRWWVSGSEAEWCGALWKKVGAPRWRYTLTGWTFLQMQVSMPLARNHIETWILEPPVALLVVWWSVIHLWFGVCIIVAAASRYLKACKLLPPPHIWVAAAAFGSSLLSFVASILTIAQFHQHLLIELAQAILTMGILGVTCLSEGRNFVIGLWVYTLTHWVGYLCACWVYYHDPFDKHSIVSFVSLSLAVMVTILRFRALRYSKRVLMEDQMQYDKIWTNLYEDEDGHACIVHLEKVVKMIGLDETPCCKQLNRVRADQLHPSTRVRYFNQASRRSPAHPLFKDLGQESLPGRADRKSPVQSMAQLYYAAGISNLLLVEKMKDWAEQSNGMIRLVSNENHRPKSVCFESTSLMDPDHAGGSTFERWIDAKSDPEMLESVKWAPMKRHARAIEKLLRSYRNEPSRLLDIARQTLVFRNMTDLTMCLGIIVTDPHVRIERLKNRMSPTFNADESGGYRDVCINLTMINQEAEQLGAEMHMCEVQLLLLSFANLKTSKGHKRYVEARNSKGA